MSGSIEQPRFSCALGAQQSVVAIRRSVPVLHSGPGCANKIERLIGQGEGYAGGSTIPCTNASEKEVVFGGETRLREVLDGAFKVIDADLFVVLTGCTSDIVGDDVGSVVKDYRKRGLPIVFAETGGFKSNNYVSHEVVVNAIIDQYAIPNRAPGGVKQGLVNVFATVPYQDPYWQGNLAELKRILTGIGFTVNILFGPESEGLSEWREIPNAQFNIVVGAWVGLRVAKHLEETVGTPYLHFPYLPVGGIASTEFLRAAGAFGGLPKQQVEAFVADEERKFYTHIERMADFILEFRYGLPRRFYSILDASYAIGFSKYLLNELGILPARQYVIDDTPPAHRKAIEEQFAHLSDRRSAEVVFETDGGRISREIRQDGNSSRALILGSGWDRDLASDLHADLLILSVPVQYRLILNCGYAGYRGGLRAIEDIYDRVLNTYR
ncbi:nitrogenase component 1 [Ethanoligenens harbinense]|uniref:Oxidoreductase/nitrogenase component 1 n=1 Tax=Ethanoligenens harbinense (strain DSM 18485 / JCM 12961 / CGMCC 1.5033 / YUAN-3) TaxID=663278 RepID=E6U988_ETHHY|nr:nitrogenase component 1 [Ethanoligenens harbinense]ADU27247.1 oxidoreductase/nitrogenase component 1 [Ethanoligenens harbinense YUAN-3]AVQ96313.1 hydrogenase [Ethanoligenens harbinense YUAN-3]AYF41724.1 hydrogenase [Ethanoligenens harbinense]QCN92554.1 hydrogenase [Ethanoligenens harbinense]